MAKLKVTTETVWPTELKVYLGFEEKVYLYGKKAMAPHSSALAWKIPWTEDPDGL